MPRLARLKSFHIARLPQVLGTRTGWFDHGFVPNESEQTFWQVVSGSFDWAVGDCEFTCR
jgi:hypothetical protein